MSEQVKIHTRQFTTELRKSIKAEALAKGYAWPHELANIPIVAREVNVGLDRAKNMLPESLKPYVSVDIDGHDYSISFYINVGHEDYES